MSLNYSVANHTLIKDPENPYEVIRVIGGNKADVGYVCTRDTLINRWAKYKPVRLNGVIDTTSQLKANNTWKSSSELSSVTPWWKGTQSSSVSYRSGTNSASGVVTSICAGLSIKQYFGGLNYLTDDWDTYGWEYFWQYLVPRGGTVTPTEPYRLIDFNYYLHTNTLDSDKDKPFYDWIMPSVVTRYGMDDGTPAHNTVWMIDGQAQMAWPQNRSSYLLTIADLEIKNGAASNYSLVDTYFGIVITNGTGGNKKYNIITSEDTWGTGNTVTRDMLFTRLFTTKFLSNGYGTYKAYPVLTKTSFACDEPGSEMDYNKSVGDSDHPIIPLPFPPVEFEYKEQPVKVQFTFAFSSASIDGSDAGTLNMTVTIKNITDVNTPAQSFDAYGAYMLYTLTVFGVGENGETDYQNSAVYEEVPINSNTYHLDPGQSTIVNVSKQFTALTRGKATVQVQPRSSNLDMVALGAFMQTIIS